MQQRYLLGIVLCAPFLLTGCFEILDGDGMVNEPVQVEVNDEVIVPEAEQEAEMKTSMTLEDFDYINENLMPKSYHYTLHNYVNDKDISEGDYEYTEDDHSVLVPPTTINKEITRSELYENSVLDTTVKYTLENGETMEVTYFNDPYTLEYISAYSFQGQTTSNYSFNY